MIQSKAEVTQPVVKKPKLKIKPQKMKKSATNKVISENLSTTQSQKPLVPRKKSAGPKQKENVNKTNIPQQPKKAVKNSDKMKDILMKNKALLKPQKQPTQGTNKIK